jgi:hypothetical protein
MDLLDRMVEQGEDWLMLTMRRLDHFERTGLAPKDYSTWCEHALGGAYDWIDHERLATSGSGAAAPTAPARGNANGNAGGGNPPDWNRSGGAPRSGYAEESPTAPVPSVSGGAQGWNGNGGQPGQQQGGDDDGKGRNIFRIFTN